MASGGENCLEKAVKKYHYSLQNQESVETKTFTWRLRPQVIQAPGDPSSKNTKISGTSGSSASRLVTSSLRQTHSATSLSTQFQTGSEQVSNFLRYQEFEVEAGQSLGLHSMWSFFLVSCGSSLPTQWSSTNISTSAASSSSPPHPPNSDFVGLFLRKVLKPSKNSEPGYTPAARNDELVARYKIEILDRDGEVLYTKDCEADSRENLEVGYWDWKKITTVSKLQAPKGKPQGRDSLDDEFLLLLRVSFTMVNRRKSVLVKAKTNQLSPEEVVSAREAGVTFLSLVDNPKGSSPDIVVEIPNRRKFNVHKSVLMGNVIKLHFVGFQLNWVVKGETCFNNFTYISRPKSCAIQNSGFGKDKESYPGG